MRTEEHVFLLRQENMRTRGPFPAPLSATRFANILHISFQLLSGYMNSAPLTCAPRIGKSIGTMGWCMSFETCESKICTHSVPFPRRCMAGGTVLLRSYLIFVTSANLLIIDYQPFRGSRVWTWRYSYSCYSFVNKGYDLCFSIYNYLIVN